MPSTCQAPRATGGRLNDPKQSMPFDVSSLWNFDHPSNKKYFPVYRDYHVSTEEPSADSYSAHPGLATSPPYLERLLNLSDVKKEKILREVLNNELPPRIETSSNVDRDSFEFLRHLPERAAAVNNSDRAGTAAEQSESSAPGAVANVTPPPGLEQMLPPGFFMAPSVPERKQNAPVAATTPVRPKKTNLKSKFTAHTGDVTTLMIRNIPCRFTQQKMMDFTDEHGFKEKYDFFYVPTGARPVKSGASNLGYAFVNFRDAADAAAFTQMLQNYKFDDTCSTKRVSIMPAHLQGLEANVRHFRRTAVKLTSQRPFICEAFEARVQKGAVPKVSSHPKSRASSSSNTGALVNDESLGMLEYVEVLTDMPLNIFE